MRCYIQCLCALLLAATATLITACSHTPEAKGPPSQPVHKAADQRHSPHHVMVSLADGTTLARDQQAYVVDLQEKIAQRWQPVPSKLKYSVGLEFTLTRAGLVTDQVRAVSSMGNKKMIEYCKDAIMRADRFGELPPQFKTAPQTFLCEFMYNPPAQSSAAASSATTGSAPGAGTGGSSGTTAAPLSSGGSPSSPPAPASARGTARSPAHN
jgi:TonB C terminal